MVIDITKESIPPAIILSYMRMFSDILEAWMVIISIIIVIGVLFTGTGKVVRDEQGNPLYSNNGKERLGRGLAVTTFRKHYHALRTLHVHFQQDNVSKVKGQ